MRTIIGLDISKNKANAAVVQDLQVVEEFQFATDVLGLRDLKQLIVALGGNVEIVFEATGVYSRRVEYFFQQNNLMYHILNPLTAKNRIRSGTRMRNNDKLDARRLALTEFTEHLTPYLMAYKQSPIYRELMDMNRFYDQINEDKKRARNRTQRAMQLTFASFTAGDNGFNFENKNAWQMLTLFPHAGIVREIGDLTEIKRIILDAGFKGIGQKTATKYATRLFKLAALNADAVAVNSDNTRQVQRFAQNVLDLMEDQDAQVARMTELGKELPEYSILQSIPAIAESTAIRLIGELGDVRRFDTRQQLNSFIGIDLTEIDSGDHLSARHVTKHGNPHARRILYWTTVLMASSTAKPNHIRDHYEKRRSESSSKKKLIVKEMDRLLRTILYLVKTNQTYSYDLARR